MGPTIRIVAESDCPICHGDRVILNSTEAVMCEKCRQVGLRLFGGQRIDARQVPEIRKARHDAV